MKHTAKVFSLALIAMLITGFAFALPTNFGTNVKASLDGANSIEKIRGPIMAMAHGNFHGNFNGFDNPAFNTESNMELNLQFDRNMTQEERIERMKELTPSLEEVEKELSENYHRFMLSDHTGENFLYGKFANGFFLGTHYIDEDGVLTPLDEKAWGIYYRGNFWGYLDGNTLEFFYGKYRGTFWKAHNLFSAQNWGTYTVYP